MQLFDRNMDTKLVKFGVTIESKQQNTKHTETEIFEETPSEVFQDIASQVTQESAMQIVRMGGHDEGPSSSQPIVGAECGSCEPMGSLSIVEPMGSLSIASSQTVQGPLDVPMAAPFSAWPYQSYIGEYEDDEPIEEEEEEEETVPPNVEVEEEAVGPNVEVEEEALAPNMEEGDELGRKDVDNKDGDDPLYVPGDDENILGDMAPTFIHDRNNPTFKEGTTFADSRSFKLALRHLAVREEWHFNTEYSEPNRFRARCSDDDCAWRIHASKLKRGNTFMVSP